MTSGHNISVVTFGDTTEQQTYPYPVTRISLRQTIPLRLFKMTREVLRQGRNADVLFVSDYGLPAALANLWLRKPIVLKIVTDFIWEVSVRRGWISPSTTRDAFQTRRHSLRVEALRAIQKAYVSAARRVIVPSFYTQSIVTGWGVNPENLQVIFNAPNLSHLNSLPDKDTLRTELGFDGPSVITIARLIPLKGVDGLIRTIARLHEDGVPAHLWIVGDGPERTRLEAQARQSDSLQRIHFTGYIEHKQAMKYLKAADVFALFSTTEGLPHVVLEAMAAGTPVVASAAGGTPETITDGTSGLLVPVGDEEALTAALKRVLTDAVVAVKLVAGGQAELERFSMARMVVETEAILRDVVEGSRAK